MHTLLASRPNVVDATRRNALGVNGAKTLFIVTVTRSDLTMHKIKYEHNSNNKNKTKKIQHELI